MNKLICFFAICLGLVACNGSGTKKNAAAGVGQTQVQEQTDRVEVLYFHGKQRCATCVAIEKNAREAVETQFADEIKRGTVVFKSIDISVSENEKIAEKYEVTWSSLFVCKWQGGKETFENLTGYAFANARTAPEVFKKEVVEKVRSFME